VTGKSHEKHAPVPAGKEYQPSYPMRRSLRRQTPHGHVNDGGPACVRQQSREPLLAERVKGKARVRDMGISRWLDDQGKLLCD